MWAAFSDLAWILGHSFIVYAPLLHGCTTVLFEGKPVGMPDAATYWRVCEQHGVAGMFTAPTAVRAMKREDPAGVLLRANRPSKLRTLLLAGERCDPDTHNWLADNLGPSVRVAEQWWQTELGWPVLTVPLGFSDSSSLPIKVGKTGIAVPGWDVRVLKPGADGGASAEFFDSQAPGAASRHHQRGHPTHNHSTEIGVSHPSTSSSAAVQVTYSIHTATSSSTSASTVSSMLRHHATIHPAPHAVEAADNELGPLVLRLPMPPGSMTTLWEDEPRFLSSYSADLDGYIQCGDAAMRDSDGYISVIGRVDDVINVAGHRLSTGSIEAAISGHPAVAEVAVVGVVDELKGHVPLALVVLKVMSSTTPASATTDSSAAIRREVGQRVRDTVGPVASLADALIVPRLPKTRSGTVLRAVIRAIADGVKYKYPSTIEDADV